MNGIANRDIAIIGISGRFPDAENIDKLYENLKNGIDSVREISQDRIKNTTLNPGEKYLVCGYLEDIDKFDHELFNISLGEAQTMGPIQRQLLETVYEAIDSTGYSVDYFRGSNTAVFAAASGSDYYKHADCFVPTLISGNMDAYLPATIARYFGFKGNAQLINTACSSSLVAVHSACQELMVGDADYALVCGANIYVFPTMDAYYDEDDKTNLNSPDGKSRAFSADASGMSCGEAAACILLKPLDKAILDKDIIYAVIKSTVVNNNADHAASIKAPNSRAQAEMLKKAWSKAGVSPKDIGYIEAHGSGTKLGDSLEIEGLDLAFQSYNAGKGVCPISTIKSNIGHGRVAAGISGLIKAVLSLKYKSIFPTVHFTKPNPLINFENSSVYVNQQLRVWNLDEGKCRYAGITSMGESGINSHVVLAEAPYFISAEEAEGSRDYLFTVSSNTLAGLKRNCSELSKKISDRNYRISDISYTLNTGRKHYKYRYAVIADNIDTLTESLKEKSYSSEDDLKPIKEINKYVLVFSDYGRIPEELINFFLSSYTVFSHYYNECKGLSAVHNDRFNSFAFQYSFYRLLSENGISTRNILGIGDSKVLCDVIANKKTLQEGLNSYLANKGEATIDLEERLARMLERESKAEPAAFIEMGPEGKLSKIASLNGSNSHYRVFCLLAADKGNPFLELLKALYISNCNINWFDFHKNSIGQKIELPAYQFEKTRCWLREEPKRLINGMAEMFSTNTPVLVEKDASEIEIKVARYWSDVLEISRISLDDDFFEIGGNSLKTTQIIERINRDFGIKLSFEDIFDFPTIRLLCESINSMMGTEQKLMLFWKEVLKLEIVSSEQSFFELGGHSLLATQILNKIKKELQLELNFEDFFMHPTISSLSAYINELLSKGKNRIEYTEIQPVEEREFYPISSAQKRMFVLNMLEGEDTSYNIPGAAIIEGRLDRELFQAVFKAIIKRHEALRTSFVMVEGEPVQKIESNPAFQVSYTIAEGEEFGKLTREFTKPFDLSIAPLLRVGLVKIGEEKHLLLFDMHHIISDGTSMGVLIKEFTALYNGEKLPELRIQYKDYSAWQNNGLISDKIKKQEEYWIRNLSGEPAALNLPTDYPRPALQSFEGDRIFFSADAKLTEGLNQLTAKTGTTLYMVLLSVYNILLYKYTGQNDITVGSPIAGRQHEELQGLIGMFVNTLAIRCFPNGEKTYNEFLNQVKEILLSAYGNQDYQFEELIGKLNIKRDLGRSPLFDTMLVLHNMRAEELNLKGLSFTLYQHENKTSKFDITITAQEAAGEISFTLEYCTRLFKKDTIQRLSEHYLKILEEITKSPERKLSEIDMLSEKEKTQLINEFNNSKEFYPKDRTIIELFEEQVRKTPDNTAVVFCDEKLTYSEFNTRVNQLAWYLRNKGVKVGNIVGIMADRSFEMLFGIFGILKAGGAYLPIDPECPEKRIKFMLADSHSDILLIQRHLKEKYSLGQELIDLNDKEIYAENCINPESINKPTDLAYVIYTSGSTGTPKGVMVKNDSVLNVLTSMQKNYPLRASDTYLLKTTYTFDVSVTELFGWFFDGGSIAILRPGDEKNPRALLESIKKYNATHINFVPSMLKLFLDTMDESDAEIIDVLKYVFVAGEALSPDLARKFKRISKKVTLANIYGPTESTVYAAEYIVPDEVEDIMPIGRPLQNIRAYILDRDNKLAPVGVHGELCLSGEGLAIGYLNRPELTDEKFVQDPFQPGGRMYRTGDLVRWLPDGNIEYLGRIDYQVKIRGFRIELGEIESRLLRHQAIKEAVVITKEDSQGSKYMVAYTAGETELPTSELREYLSKELPDYMIPSFFVHLDKLPLTSTGKIDRKALPGLGDTINTGTEYEAPRDELESALVQIWQELLNINKIGINDSFFEMGGHSLNAITLVSKLQKSFNVKISLNEIFINRSILNLAEVVRSRLNVRNEIEALLDEIEGL